MGDAVLDNPTHIGHNSFGKSNLDFGSDPRMQTVSEDIDRGASLAFILKLKPKKMRYKFEEGDNNNDDGGNFDDTSGNRVGFNIADIYNDCENYRDLINSAEIARVHPNKNTTALEAKLTPTKTGDAGLPNGTIGGGRTFENKVAELKYLDFIGYLVSAMQKQDEVINNLQTLITNLQTSLEISDKKLGHVTDFLNGK